MPFFTVLSILFLYKSKKQHNILQKTANVNIIAYICRNYTQTKNLKFIQLHDDNGCTN